MVEGGVNFKIMLKLYGREEWITFFTDGYGKITREKKVKRKTGGRKASK